MWKRLPKRGFYNRFHYTYNALYLSDLDAAIRAGKIDPSRVITSKHLYDVQLIDKKAYNKNGVALIGSMPDFEIPIDIEVRAVNEIQPLHWIDHPDNKFCLNTTGHQYLYFTNKK